MPERQITIKVSLEGLTDASTQAKGFTSDVQGVGDAAAGAAAKAAPLADTVDKTGTALKQAASVAGELSGALKDKLAPAGEAAYNAFEKLAASQGPRGLARSIVQAQVAADELKKSVEAATKAGEKMPDSVTRAMKTMQSDIDAATVKLGAFRKAQADVGASAATSGSQLDALRMRAGSLTSMFDSMERTGTGATKMIGQLGLGLGIAGAAFAGAEAAGHALGKVLLEMEGGYSKFVETEKKATDQADLEKRAMEAAAAGHIKVGDSMKDTVHNYEIYIATSGKAGIAVAEFAAQLKKIEAPTNLKEAALNLNIFATALAGMHGKGIESAAAFMAANKTAIDKIVAGYATMGQVIPKEFQRVIDSQKQAVAAQKLLTEEGAQAAVESLAKIAAARKLADEADVKATQKAVENAEKAMKALNAETVSAEEYSKRKKAIYEAETAAVEAAVDAQALASAKAELDQAKLAKSMGVSAFAFQQVREAADQYALDLAKGVQPSVALASATDRLEKSIQNTQEALPKFDTGLRDLALRGMKVAADESAALTKQTDEMSKHLEESAKGVNILADALRKLGMPDTAGAVEALTTKFEKLGVAILRVAVLGA